MSRTERDLIHTQRRKLQNPYALIEHLEDEALEKENAHRAQLDQADRHGDQVSLSRKLLENPYAYLDGSGGFDALSRRIPRHSAERKLEQAQSASSIGSTSFSIREIEAKVREIHEMIWRERTAVWGDDLPSNPIDLLDPAVALELLGYHCHEEGLGDYQTPNGPIEVAGLIDQASRTVRISSQFPMNVRMFTLAHELGHAVLHPTLRGVHRDRPLDGAGTTRNHIERAADKFATLFLMPAKLVRNVFLDIFKQAPFVLDEATSFALAGCSTSELRQRCKTPRHLSRLLANSERYDGRQLISSMAARFHVATEPMAIRLEELELVSL